MDQEPVTDCFDVVDSENKLRVRTGIGIKTNDSTVVKKNYT